MLLVLVVMALLAAGGVAQMKGAKVGASSTALARIPDPAETWFERIPTWIRWTWVPIVGSLGLLQAGLVTRQRRWILISIGLGCLGLVAAPLSGWGSLGAWVAQIVLARVWRRPFLARTYPADWPLPRDPALVREIAPFRDPVDINRCTRHQLVHDLGLPIVYANEIESLRVQGSLMLSVDDLRNLVRLPEETIERLEPVLQFQYYSHEAEAVAWQRLNTDTQAQLVAHGWDPGVAAAIVQERRRGPFRSPADAGQRVGFEVETKLL